jgi:hypothetical protein
VRVNAQQLARVPVSAITTPRAIGGKASWSSSEDEDDESTDSTDSRGNKSKSNHNHAKKNDKNKKNEKPQEREPQKEPALSLTRNRSIGEDSIDKVRRALEEVEEELNEAQKNGKKISRETLTQALFSVADKLESPEECISMRRQVSRFLANDKKIGCYDCDDEEITIHSDFERNGPKGAMNNSSRQQQQQGQEDAGARNKGSRSRPRADNDEVKGASSWESSKLNEGGSAGSESGFTAWAAELEDDSTGFDFDLRPEADFFSEVYGFFSGGVKKVKSKPAPSDVKKVKKKPAPRNVRSWDDTDADSKITGFTGLESQLLNEDDDEGVFSGVFSGLESSPSAPRNKYEPPVTSAHVTRGPSLVVDKSNDYELPPPPHAMRSQPLFGARSTIQHSTTIYQSAPASKSASKRANAKPARPSRWRSKSPRNPREHDSEDDDILSLSSIESALYQGRRDPRSQSRRHIPDDGAIMMTVLSKDEDDKSVDFGSKRRDFHLREQRISTQQRQRSRSAHAPRQRSFKDGVASRMLI